MSSCMRGIDRWHWWCLNSRGYVNWWYVIKCSRPQTLHIYMLCFSRATLLIYSHRMVHRRYIQVYYNFYSMYFTPNKTYIEILNGSLSPHQSEQLWCFGPSSNIHRWTAIWVSQIWRVIGILLQQNFLGMTVLCVRFVLLWYVLVS